MTPAMSPVMTPAMCLVMNYQKPMGKGGVADGTRTRNDQNHNLGIYH